MCCGSLEGTACAMDHRSLPLEAFEDFLNRSRPYEIQVALLRESMSTPTNAIGEIFVVACRIMRPPSQFRPQRGGFVERVGHGPKKFLLRSQILMTSQLVTPMSAASPMLRACSELANLSVM